MHLRIVLRYLLPLVLLQLAILTTRTATSSPHLTSPKYSSHATCNRHRHGKRCTFFLGGCRARKCLDRVFQHECLMRKYGLSLRVAAGFRCSSSEGVFGDSDAAADVTAHSAAVMRQACITKGY